jgi:hypothetical protein
VLLELMLVALRQTGMSLQTVDALQNVRGGHSMRIQGRHAPLHV